MAVRLPRRRERLSQYQRAAWEAGSALYDQRRRPWVRSPLARYEARRFTQLATLSRGHRRFEAPPCSTQYLA